MMKKYNQPTIETLALETIDVIATSGNVAAQDMLADMTGFNPESTNIDIEKQLREFNTTWSW